MSDKGSVRRKECRVEEAVARTEDRMFSDNKAEWWLRAVEELYSSPGTRNLKGPRGER